MAGIEIFIMDLQKDGSYGPRKGSTRTSDERGEARWENLMPGETTFEAPRMAYGFLENTQHSYVRWWRENEPVEWSRAKLVNNAPTLREGVEPIVVDMAANLQPIRVLMEKGAKISGVVKGPDGAPMQGATVGVAPSDGRSGTLTGAMRYSVKTNERGSSWVIFRRGNGVIYRLCAYYWMDKPAIAANAISEPFQSKARDELAFALSMAKGGWIVGRVVDAQGQPVADMKVSSKASDRLDISYADKIATTDKGGSYRIGPLRPGGYDVKAGEGGGDRRSGRSRGATAVHAEVAGRGGEGRGGSSDCLRKRWVRDDGVQRMDAGLAGVWI